MSLCTKCGKQNADSAKFCTGCGATLKDSAFLLTPDSTMTEARYPLASERSLNSKTKWIVIGIIGLLALGAGVYLLFFNVKKENSEAGVIVTEKNNNAFIGEWTSYNKDLRISTVDTLYSIEFYDKNGQIIQSYNGNKIGDLISYRDNGGIGRQIQLYIPVNSEKPNDKNGVPILKYEDSLNIRLIVSGDGDYYKKFKSVSNHGLKGFAGTWRMDKINFDGIYETIAIDSTSKGIQVAWKFQSWYTDTTYATFNDNILNVPATAVDGGVNFTYFKDCDCITKDNNKYYRYSENDSKFLGHFKNETGEIYISKNGNYYLVSIDGDQDYTNTFLTTVKANALQQPIDKYAQGATYMTITYLSPGIISDDGGSTKYYKTDTHSKSVDYPNNTNESANNKTQPSSAKSFSGKVGKLDALYNLQWNTDGTINGTYYYPKRANITYTLMGRDLGNGNIELTEYTNNNISAHFNLHLQDNCYVGQINNTDGRVFNIVMCE